MKCSCCRRNIVKHYRKDCWNRRYLRCNFCYSYCPAHMGECYANYNKDWSPIKHKLIEKNFWGVGKALCTKKSIKSYNSNWYWKDVNCKKCLNARARK